MPTGTYDRKRSARQLMSDEARKEKNRERSKAQYHKDPDRARNLKLKRAYGITLEQYTEFSTFCGHVCGICDRACPSKRRLAVDHDHSNGVIRGLLCINCNKGLGNFKDDPELLTKAIQYLTAYKEALKEHAINSEQL